MENRDFDKDKLINYWISSSDDDFETMNVMFNTKRYNWSLFIGHLMIEKLLKAYFVIINNDFPPFIHNLLRLAEKCNIELNEEQKEFFVTVTAFNINARYNDYKKEFYNRCTREYTRSWIDRIKELRKWIEQIL